MKASKFVDLVAKLQLSELGDDNVIVTDPNGNKSYVTDVRLSLLDKKLYIVISDPISDNIISNTMRLN